MTVTFDLATIVLQKGGHSRRGKQSVCFMEAVAWFAGEKHSDRPECVSPVLSAFLRRWNDDLDDEGRQRLKKYIPLVVGTAGNPESDEIRAWMATDWMVRVHTPAWLRLVGLESQAVALEQLPPIMSMAAAVAGQPAISAARDSAGAARGAAWDAAWGAALGAALGAARGAAWDAAWDAARGAAWGAARGAAWDAAWDAALDAAWDAALDAALGAAWDAARGAAWDAARGAAWGALQPTVVSLQQSAFDLLDRMIAVGTETP